MSLYSVIFGAAYIGPYTEWGWINTIAVIIVGIFLFWILYKLVLSRMNWGTRHTRKARKVEHVVVKDKDKANAEGITPIHEKEEDIEAEEVIAMPLEGELIEISKVPDPIFSEKMIGDGFAIRPSKGEILSPVNGWIKEVQPNRASITFSTKAGRDVILHIGLSTLNQEDIGITLNVKEGDQVEAGKTIGMLDLGKMNLLAKSTISPVVFPNLKERERVVVKQQGLVDAGMTGIVVIEIDK